VSGNGIAAPVRRIALVLNTHYTRIVAGGVEQACGPREKGYGRQLSVFGTGHAARSLTKTAVVRGTIYSVRGLDGGEDMTDGSTWSRRSLQVRNKRPILSFVSCAVCVCVCIGRKSYRNNRSRQRNYLRTRNDYGPPVFGAARLAGPVIIRARHRQRREQPAVAPNNRARDRSRSCPTD